MCQDKPVAYPISKAANNSRNQGEKLIEPA
jgi:hypothetical protein